MLKLDLPIEDLDEAFSLTAAYLADLAPVKVSLGAGVYRDDAGQPWILPSVQEAKKIIASQANDNHEYLPIGGSDGFLVVAKSLCFGTQQQTRAVSSIKSVQTISGTGANHLAALFCAHYLQPRKVFIPDPTWSNHHLIWQTAAGPWGVKAYTYPYYDAGSKSFDCDGLLQTLDEEAEVNDVVILQACAHNPTGLDPSVEQWKQIAEIIKRKRLFPVFDSAYQGFATGDVDRDAWAIRYFADALFPPSSKEQTEESCVAGMMVCQSFSKNFGLYGERVGALHLMLPIGVQSEGAYSKLLKLTRAEISNSPRFGAGVVEKVLTTPNLTVMWQQDLQTMSSRIRDMRALLKRRLLELGSKLDWDHIESQIGMFAYTGLDEAQVARLKEEFHVYLMRSGRASISGLNESNVDYVAEAMHVVTSS